MNRTLAFVALLLAGCPTSGVDDDDATTEEYDLLTPAFGSMTGYYPLTIDLSEVDMDAADVTSVTVGGIKALDLEPGDGAITVLVQGAPEAGDASIDLHTADGTTRVPQRFHYDPPLDPEFDRVVAFGASLTQGVFDGTPTHDGVMLSPALQLARVMGAYMPQPVLVDPLFPTLGLDSVGPAPECDSASVADFIRDAITDVLSEMVDPDEGLAYWVGRSDPDLQVRNLAAGNYMVDDVIVGPSADELVQNMLGGLSVDPYAPFGGGPRWTMLEAVERLEPTVIVSFDLVGNDVLSRTPLEDIEEHLVPIMERLADTGAHVFLAEMPDPAILRGNLGGPDSGDEQSQLAADVNVLLHREADDYPNVHIVPVAAEALDIATNGLSLGGQELTGGMLGGLLSFDGLHFSPTGYALVADMFVDAINAELDTAIPPIDAAAILADDIHSPDAVRAAGREPTECVSGG